MSYRDGAAWAELDTFGEEDEIDDNEYRYATRDHILFCIDASRGMREPIPAGGEEGGTSKSPLHMALEVVLKVQRGKVLSGPQDSVGVLLWNVDPATPPLTLPPRKKGEQEVTLENFRPGCYLFQALRPISAEEIKRVKAFLDEANEQIQEDSSAEPDVLQKAFPPIAPGSELDIADVFECCNHVIRDAGAALGGQKRVFLITSEEKPERGDAFVDGRDTRGPARTRFLDLSSLGVQVDPFFISTDGKTFDEDVYWNDILLRDSADAESDSDTPDGPRISSTPSDGIVKLRELMEEQVTRTSTKRVLFSVPLTMGDKGKGKGEIMISVNGYSMYAETKKPTYRYYDLSGRAAEEVRTKTTYVSANTGESVSKEQIGYAYPFGKADGASALHENYWDGGTRAKKEADDEERAEKKPEIRTRIAFRDDEIKQFKTMGMTPQIKIIGFYDPSNLDFAHNIKHSVFIYPNEKIFGGSTRTFAALLASCAKRDRYGLALCMFRANSTPVFCCMIPQIETLLSNGHQDLPPGFHLVPLPYTDDIRARPEKVAPDVVQACNKEQRDKMLAVVSKLRMRQRSYEPSAYPNPSLAYFYAKLQSLAFEEEFFDPLSEEDKTAPLTIGMHKVAGKLMQDFKEEVDSDVRVQYSAAMPKKKRPAATGAEDVDDGFIEGYWKNGKLEKLTVPQLKAYCSKHGLSTEGKKADLLRTVQAHFDAGGGSTAKKQKT